MKIIHALKGKLLRNVKGKTETDWVVRIVSGVIQTIDFQQKENTVLINDIVKIEVETNDSGPWGVDLWWKIEAAGNVIWIPSGATGELDLKMELLKFDGFDADGLSNAIQSNSNQSFLLWSKVEEKVC